MNVAIDIPNQAIDDLIVTALEQGIGYWASDTRLFDNNENQTLNKTDNPTKNLSSIIIVETEGDDGGETEHTLRFSGSGYMMVRNFSQVVYGLKKMANRYPQHFANIISGDADAETADVFIQCCLFGEVEYS